MCPRIHGFRCKSDKSDNASSPASLKRKTDTSEPNRFAGCQRMPFTPIQRGYMRFVALVTTTGISFNERRAIRHHVLSVLPTLSGGLAEACLPGALWTPILYSALSRVNDVKLHRQKRLMHLSISTTGVKDHNTENRPHNTLFHHDASRSATKLRAFFGALIHCSCKPSLSSRTVALNVAAVLITVRSLTSRQPVSPTFLLCRANWHQ